MPFQYRHVCRGGQRVRLHPQGAGPFSGGGGGEGPHPFPRRVPAPLPSLHWQVRPGGKHLCLHPQGAPPFPEALLLVPQDVDGPTLEKVHVEVTFLSHVEG